MQMDSGGGYSTFGLSSFNSTRGGGAEPLTCWNIFWLTVPAALVTIRLQAKELNAQVVWNQGMILHMDIGESLAI